MIRIAAFFAAALAASACSAQAAMPVPPAPVTAIQPPEATVDAFHAALRAGDREAALALLDDKVLILEGGGAERDKADYAGHHLGADMEFTKAVPGTVTRRFVEAGPEMAVVASEGTAKGRFRGRDIDSVTAETMVLRRTPAGWRIIHIHWSSDN